MQAASRERPGGVGCCRGEERVARVEDEMK
jgi:hypothetical protein